MKKLMTILGAVLVSSLCFAQQLKTYNGNYDIQSYDCDIFGVSPGMFTGTASYTYYEDEDLQRIRSGKFTYNGKIGFDGNSSSVSITGNYIKNKKNGQWVVNQIFSIPESRRPGRVSVPASTGKRVFSGNFKDGLPNGLWTSTLTITQKGKTATGTYTLNFTNNVLSGEFRMTTNDGTGNSILGSLDKNGYFTGKTIVKKDGDEYQITFNNGLLVSSIGRNLQSGNVFENYKINEEELAFFNQLLIEKDTAIIEEIPFRIVNKENDRINSLISNEFKDDFKNASLFNVTPGDLSIDENNKYNWIGFKIIALEKRETRTEKITRLKAEEENRQMIEKERQRAYQEQQRAYQEQQRAFQERERLEAENKMKTEANSLNSVAWESLLKKDYPSAINFCLRGIELDNENLYLKATLAHSYLLNGDFQKAREIYIANLGLNLDSDTTWQKMIEMDFIKLNSKEIQSENMERILFEIRMNPEDRNNYESISEKEKFKQYKKYKNKARFNKFMNEVILN